MKLINIFPQRGSHLSVGDLLGLFTQMFELSQYKCVSSLSSHLKVHVASLLLCTHWCRGHTHLGQTCALYFMPHSPLGHLSITSQITTLYPLSWSYQHSQPSSTLLLFQLLKKEKLFKRISVFSISFTLTL